MSPEEARAFPLLTNPLFKLRLSKSPLADAWRTDVSLHNVGDTLLMKGNQFIREWTDIDIRSELERTYSRWQGDSFRVKDRWVSVAKWLEDWKELLEDIPIGLLMAAKQQYSDPNGVGVVRPRYSGIAKRIMSLMGWEGKEGLGPFGWGIREPPTAVGTAGGCGGPGLGYSNPPPPAPKPLVGRHANGVRSRLRVHTVRGIPRIEFHVWPKTLSELKVVSLAAPPRLDVYGYYDHRSGRIQACDFTVKGKLVRTNTYYQVEEDALREVLTDGHGGVLGIAEMVFPHPTSWRFSWIGSGNIATATVRQLTAALTFACTTPPTCKTSWEERLDHRILWDRVALITTSALVTPRDFASYMKNIVHRCFLVRHIDANAPSSLCRCCKRTEERTLHLFARCEHTSKVWVRFLSLLQPHSPPGDQFYLFGLINERVMPPAFRALFVIVWKFIIIALTDLGMHGTPFTPHTIWRSAVRRFLEKARACEFGAKLAIDRASGRGEPHNIGSRNKALTPLGGLDDKGILSLRPDFQAEVERLLLGAPSGRGLPTVEDTITLAAHLSVSPPTVAPLLFHPPYPFHWDLMPRLQPRPYLPQFDD
jgi:hypothetical protein